MDISFLTAVIKGVQVEREVSQRLEGVLDVVPVSTVELFSSGHIGRNAKLFNNV